MKEKTEVTKEIDRLIKEGAELFPQMEKGLIDFSQAYQAWYTESLKVVRVLAPDRYLEFCAYYEGTSKRKDLNVETYGIRDFVRGLGPRPHPVTQEVAYDPKDIVKGSLINQVFIIKSLRSRIEGIVAELQRHLTYNIQDAELSAARELVKVNLMEAGTVAGVVLEKHLQQVAASHQLSISKKHPTIGDLNHALRVADVYDLPMFRKVEGLADIRNICAHQKQREPKPEEIDDLLTGVQSLIRNLS